MINQLFPPKQRQASCFITCCRAFEMGQRRVQPSLVLFDVSGPEIKTKEGPALELGNSYCIYRLWSISLL